MDLLNKLRIPSDDDPLSDEIPDHIPESISGGESGHNSVRDPVPGQAAQRPAAAKERAKPVPAAAPRVTKKIREEVTEEVQVYLEMLAWAWSMSAPPCGEALSESSQVIANKITNLMARNPRLIAKFRDAGVVSDWMQLGVALKAVAQAAYGWYVAKEKEEDDAFDPTRFAAYTAS